VIRIPALLHILGQFILALSGVLLVPLLVALFDGEDPSTLAYSFMISFGAGMLLYLACPRPMADVSVREGLLLVAGIWLAISLIGCLPFYFSPHFHGFTNAFFEAVSGFTTTGATVLSDVSVLPRSLHFWRCFSHWLGGMGIVLLGIAVLPLLGLGGMQMYRAEFSGAKSEKLKPRIAETALALWRIYFVLTVAQYVALRSAGLNIFDALCHTFSTLGTGGFSTRTASVGEFQSPAVEYIIIVFMLLAGLNFTLHYRLWIEWQPRRFFSDLESRFYLAIVLIAAGIICISLLRHNGYQPEVAVRRSLFQAVSIMTTTGFVTDDYEQWRPLPQLILLALMFVGGCTGSTSGGLKAFRVLLLSKVVTRDFKQLVERRGVFAVRLGSQVIRESVIENLLSLVYLAFLVNFASCILLAACGLDVLTSISAVAAAMFNVGPGLAMVGPVQHYGHLPVMAKWVLSGCMLAGRLEFYTLLIVCTPAFWRK